MQNSATNKLGLESSVSCLKQGRDREGLGGTALPRLPLSALPPPPPPPLGRRRLTHC